MKIIMILIWGILFFMSTISLFVFTHELTHVIRFNEPEMMCLGFGDNFGVVVHYNPFTETQIVHEELVANVVASIVTFGYLGLTFYLVYGGVKNAKQ